MEFFGNLAHQITLLAINEQTGRVRNRGQLKLAAAGATLAELAMQERVSLVDKKVQVHDALPIGDPLLDAMLRVLGTHPAHRPARIIQAGGGFYLDQSLEDMTRSGWLVKTPARGLGGDRYRILNAQELSTARELAATAIRDPAGVTSRAACLGGLALELQFGKWLAPEAGWRQRWRSQRVLQQRDWVVKAVHDIIASQQSATTAAISS